VPRQEAFVVRNRERLRGVGWIKTCGGLFDYFLPTSRRAPQWMQKAGIEWLFRGAREPQKYLWRYATTNGTALWLLLTRTR
jgi:exopolysaccharide biosynthesis WecB/TagA/CpsF family protein